MIEYTGKDLKEILEAMRKLILFCTDKETWKLCDEIIVDLKEHDAKVREDVIEEVFGKIEERLNDSKNVTIDLPVEEVLGEMVDMDDFLMLAEEIVQEYKDLIFSKLAQAKKQLKEQKE